MPRIVLTVLPSNASPVRVALDTDVVTMGRATNCTVPIDDRFLSRHHAEITASGERWVVRDCGSANGTFLNGARIYAPVPIEPGDKILLGNTQVRFENSATSTEPRHTRSFVGDNPNSWGDAPANTENHPIGLGLPITEEGTGTVRSLVLSESDVDSAANNVRFSLAMELIADRPMSELFEIIVDQVVKLMSPSRVALALLSVNGREFEIVKYGGSQSPDFVISRTLLQEVVRDRKVISYTDVGSNAELANAHSIVGQSIYSALCAPLIVGEHVLGVLYLDYRLSARSISSEDALIAAQIARIAAIKLESTRLRDAALEKERLDESLRLAQAIQMRMLPQVIPALTDESTYDISASIRPAKTVGGDFYDFHLTADSKLYFCIGDVSGKGVPAALMMAVCRALLRSLILRDESPKDVLSAVNRQLCDETDAGMFVTAFFGVLDLKSGEIRYSNAGHNPPLLVSSNGRVEDLPTKPGLVLGFLPAYQYLEESITLGQGDLLFLYTDGISEATNVAEELFTIERLKEVLRQNAPRPAAEIDYATISTVDQFVGDAPQSDDLTLLCFRYLKPPG